MKVLVVGGGGREHAIAWKLSSSLNVERVFVAPGNAGTATENKCTNIPIDAGNMERLAQFAKEEGVHLTVVGPEAPLAEGIVDYFNEIGLKCLGPTKAAARLESSKAFAKEFMEKNDIPTARFRTFEALEPAVAFTRELGFPVVIKADGLAAGKGVIIANNEDEARITLEEMLSGKAFGEAGKKVVVEEFLKGEEASFIVLTNGSEIISFPTSQDHKTRDEGDVGPNTGGMGAYSPAPVVTEKVFKEVLQCIIMPTVLKMGEQGNPYVGFLYAGLMIKDERPYVLEFNCRLGDPEAQPILMRLGSDLLELCLWALGDEVSLPEPNWDQRAALGVVMASQGYPFSYKKGDVIYGLEGPDPEGVKVFHAGTAIKNGQIVTNGGRVLCVTALGDTIAQAKTRAYERVSMIKWDGCFFRRDIGDKAIRR